MRPVIRLSRVAFTLALLHAQTPSDPGGVLKQLTVARFAGSGNESIQAMTSDAAGNIYVAGTTSSPDLIMKNPAQPSIGESLLVRSDDRGVTWRKLHSPPVAPLSIRPHPGDPQTLFAGGVDGIYKTSDGGQTWRHVYSGGSISSSGIVIDPANPLLIYAYMAGRSPFLISADGGETWQARTGPTYPAGCGWIRMVPESWDLACRCRGTMA